VVPPTQNQVSTVAPPTYGEMLTAAFASVETACADEVGPFTEASHAADVVTDFERLLAVTGGHLALLLSPPASTAGRQATSERHRELARRMTLLDLTRAGGNAWALAGDRLGIAHDLVATHLGRRGELLTPEASILTGPAVRESAVERVVTLARAPLSQAVELLREATAAQPRTDPPLTSSRVAHVRQVTGALNRLMTKPGLVTPTELRQLDALTPARTRIAERSRPDTGASGLEALHLVRLLSLRQSRGQERANAHSIQDLCVLAIAACAAAEEALPYAATPLGRVERASTLDRLREARARWSELAAQLHPRVHGLAKAPRLYHDTAQALSRDCAHNPGLARAVLATLPRLAAEAGLTVTRLGNNHELVAPSRRPGELTIRWRPLEPEALHHLATGLASAGQASRNARTALRGPLETRRRIPPTTEPPTVGRARGLGVAQ